MAQCAVYGYARFRFAAAYQFYRQQLYLMPGLLLFSCRLEYHQTLYIAILSRPLLLLVSFILRLQMMAFREAFMTSPTAQLLGLRL